MFTETNIAERRSSISLRHALTDKLSMIEILAKRDDGKRRFEVELNDEPSLKPRNDNILTVEITVQPQSFDGKICQLVVARDVSHVLQH